MGGKAVKGVRRFAHDEFMIAANRVGAALHKALPGRWIELVPSIHKQDYGDADFLVESDGLDHGWSRAVIDALGASEVHANGGVWSLNVRELQVDLILTPAVEYEFALRYFSFNDAGNLVGRTAHKMGFKFGHRGMLYCLRDGTHLVDELLVTRDFGRALRFLDYAPNGYAFRTLEQIFEYVAGSRYFQASSYDLDNMSHRARIRDKKRPTYQAFLAWLADHPQDESVPIDKERELARAKVAFPEFNARLARAVESMGKKREFRARFNGELVAGLTGLAGQPLGSFMARLRQVHPDFEAYVLGLTDQQLADAILTAHNLLVSHPGDAHGPGTQRPAMHHQERNPQDRPRGVGEEGAR